MGFRWLNLIRGDDEERLSSVLFAVCLFVIRDECAAEKLRGMTAPCGHSQRQARTQKENTDIWIEIQGDEICEVKFGSTRNVQ